MDINMDLIIEAVLFGILVLIGFSGKSLLNRVKVIENGLVDLGTRLTVIESDTTNKEKIIEEKLTKAAEIKDEQFKRMEDNITRSLQYFEKIEKRIGELETKIDLFLRGVNNG